MVEDPPTNARDTGSIPGLERSPGEGNGSPLQHSCLGNARDRGVWQARESDITTKQQQKNLYLELLFSEVTSSHLKIFKTGVTNSAF